MVNVCHRMDVNSRLNIDTEQDVADMVDRYDMVEGYDDLHGVGRLDSMTDELDGRTYINQGCKWLFIGIADCTWWTEMVG